jgi:hypothetical protein
LCLAKPTDLAMCPGLLRLSLSSQAGADDRMLVSVRTTTSCLLSDACKAPSTRPVRPTSWHSSKGLAGFTTARRDSDFRSQPLAALLHAGRVSCRHRWELREYARFHRVITACAFIELSVGNDEQFRRSIAEELSV